MAPLMTIGDFSRAAHLSIKTLRHYHEVGLLEPVQVAPGSGYRYYSDQQIPAAQVIRRLRNLEMPVSEVRSVLATDDADVRNRLITGHLDRLESELTRTRSAVAELRDLLSRPAAPRPVRHRTVEPVSALAVSALVERDDLLAWWYGALGELGAAVGAQGLEAVGTAGGLYSDELLQGERGEATVFIPINATARPVGRAVPTVIPGAELAIVTHNGGLSGIDLAYGDLGSYVTHHEIGVDGPLREYYLCGVVETRDQDAWETEIGWPVFRADGDAGGHS